LYQCDLSGSADYIEDRIKSFVEEKEYALAYKRTLPWLNDPEKRHLIAAEMQKVRLSLARTSGSLGLFGLGLDPKSMADQFKEEVRICVPSLWPGMNACSGGFAKRELTVFAGVANVGKSWMLAHAAASGVAAGDKVIVYTCEMEESLVLLRILSILTGRSTEDVRHALEFQDPAIYAQLNSYYQAGAQIVVKELISEGVDAIRNNLMSIKATTEWSPDLVVIDYADLLLKDSNNDSKETRHQLAAIYRDLRSLGPEYETAVVTASQLNRQAANKERPTMYELAECWEKAAISDVIWVIGQTDDEEKAGRLRLFNAKNRNKKRGSIISLQVNYSIGQMEQISLDQDQFANTGFLQSQNLINNHLPTDVPFNPYGQSL